MKILGICGSPRKGSTEYALRETLAAAASLGAETELLTLRAKNIRPCVHCNKCRREDADRCIIFHDDMEAMYDKFFEADGYIIGSPVYEQNISPQLCIFFSRFRANWNIKMKKPMFFPSKLGAALSVGASRNGGQEKTNDAITAFYQTNGITVVGGGAGGYNGGLLWAPDQDHAIDSIREDIEGLEVVRELGEKMYRMLSIMEEGKIK